MRPVRGAGLASTERRERVDEPHELVIVPRADQHRAAAHADGKDHDGDEVHASPDQALQFLDLAELVEGSQISEVNAWALVS